MFAVGHGHIAEDLALMVPCGWDDGDDRQVAVGSHLSPGGCAANVDRNSFGEGHAPLGAVFAFAEGKHQPEGQVLAKVCGRLAREYAEGQAVVSQGDSFGPALPEVLEADGEARVSEICGNTAVNASLACVQGGNQSTESAGGLGFQVVALEYGEVRAVRRQLDVAAEGVSLQVGASDFEGAGRGRGRQFEVERGHVSEFAVDFGIEVGPGKFHDGRLAVECHSGDVGHQFLASVIAVVAFDTDDDAFRALFLNADGAGRQRCRGEGPSLFITENGGQAQAG